MQYQITSDNIEISESMKALAKEKFTKIESRLTEKELEEALVRIVLNKSGGEDEFRVKVELTYGGKKYFGSEKDYKIDTALIEAISEVERMRRKEDTAYYEDWNEQRELKRDLGEVMIKEDGATEDEVEDDQDDEELI